MTRPRPSPQASRDAKAANTRRAYGRGWAAFTAWADAHGYQYMPAAPRTVALYLGHLAADGKSLATINQARAAISHAHAAEGIAKSDNPARHPVVAEAIQGLAESGSRGRTGGRPHRPGPGPGPDPGDRPPSQTRSRGTHGDQQPWHRPAGQWT